MNRKIINLLKGLLALSCILTTVTTVQAEDKSMTVTYTGTSTYSVDIPASTALKDENGVQVGNYEISVSGDFLNTEKLVVVPDKTITMTETTNLGKADVNATVVQEKTEWLSSELGTTPTTTGTITTTKDLGAGTWNGTVNFNISLEEYEEISGEPVLLSGSEFYDVYDGVTSSIVFTNVEPADHISSSSVKSLAADGSNAVVGWYDWIEKVYYVSTRRDDVKIVFNKDCSEMFNANYSAKIVSIEFDNVDTSQVTNMKNMFKGYDGRTLDLRNFDTSSVENMEGMFMSAIYLTDLDVTSFNTENVTNMSYMFSGLGITSLDLSSFNTAKVTKTNYMFASCNELTTIYAGSEWTNTGYSSSSENMFYSCTKLKGEMNYTESRVDYYYARTSNGYLTYKG